MSFEIVEIALEHFTDWAAFEGLATEVMRDEGHYDIHPLGGSGDKGRDATEEQCYSSRGKMRTVFQFTLQSDVAAKTRQTIKRLIEAGEEFQQLVIVSRAVVTTHEQDALAIWARKEHGIELRVYDRKLLISRLSDFNNGMFHRYFPDVQRQFRDLATQGQHNVADERHALRVWHAFVLHDRARATSRSLLDHLVLRTLFAVTKASADKLRVRISADLKISPPSEKHILGSLRRLADDGLVEREAPEWHVSLEAATIFKGQGIARDRREVSIVSDTIETAVSSAGLDISDNEKARMKRNARAVLISFFKLRGLELADTFVQDAPPTPIYESAMPGIQEAASRQISSQLGKLVLTALADALQSPTEDQAEYFAGCARAFLAVQLMDLDPTVQELQADRLKKKKFVLDTDFVLRSVIEENPLGPVYAKLARALLEVGCEVIVPRSVLKELATLFKIAPRHYETVSQVLPQLSAAVMPGIVQDVLVQGYYHSLGEAAPSGRGFIRYRRNYYDPNDSEAFLAQLVYDKMPGVVVADISVALGVELATGDLRRFQKTMLRLAETSPSGRSRTARDNRSLSEVDAGLMLAVVEYDGRTQGQKLPLGQGAYIVTASGRYSRAGKKLGLRERVSARPEVLIELLETVGREAVSDRELVGLFENSMLQDALSDVMDDVRILLDYGVSLKGVSLTRLKWDAEERIHNKITGLRALETEKSRRTAAKARREKHMALVDGAKGLGYSLAPALEHLMSKSRTLEEENVALRKALTKRRRWVDKQRKKEEARLRRKEEKKQRRKKRKRKLRST